MLGASGVPPELLAREVARTRTLTDSPFGINLIIAEDAGVNLQDDRRFFLEQIAAAAHEGFAAVVFFWGDPEPFVDAAHRDGVC